ncbi:MAG TPA: hypothetical protein DEP69_03725, partial [Acidimicrobiaceae bacterium]|nr:hypothetical protein [Acidimicrobiaceae bacterium]
LGAVHHVSVNVPDVDAAAAFYTDVLGMEVLDRPDFRFDGRWLRTGAGAEVHLIEVADWVPPAGQHWAFGVGDIDAAVAELRSHDVEVGDPVAVGGTGARQAFFSDPAGNMIELNQPARPGAAR